MGWVKNKEKRKNEKNLISNSWSYIQLVELRH